MDQPLPNWKDKGPNLEPLLVAQGVFVCFLDGIYVSNDAARAQSMNDAFDYVADRKAAKLVELADFRWHKEIGGITVNGLQIDTTDRSKTLVTGALIIAQADPTQTFEFKTIDGIYVRVNASQMVGIYQAIATWVQTCFANEQIVAAQINALTDAQAVIDFDIEAAWPK